MNAYPDTSFLCALYRQQDNVLYDSITPTMKSRILIVSLFPEDDAEP